MAHPSLAVESTAHSTALQTASTPEASEDAELKAAKALAAALSQGNETQIALALVAAGKANDIVEAQHALRPYEQRQDDRTR